MVYYLVMKSIIESILDIDDTMDQADETIKANLELTSAAAWLTQHGCKNVEKYLDMKNNNRPGWERYIDAKEGYWKLDAASIMITAKDKTIPDYVKIGTIGNLSIQGWTGKSVPFPRITVLDALSIRNCPNLDSLEGCPVMVRKFAVSGCPKLKSLDGAPSTVIETFKAINNGVKFSEKDIKKVCKIDKKKMIYDA